MRTTPTMSSVTGTLFIALAPSKDRRSLIASFRGVRHPVSGAGHSRFREHPNRFAHHHSSLMQ
ncbi:MAG: hypothetical protein V2J55_14550 [Candidatus Competibacteraceae bacterium]|nr:hypothetical protein [Candidatus Competibacteraceae bacterium]